MRQEDIINERKEQEVTLKERFVGRVDKEDLFAGDFRQSNFAPQGYDMEGNYGSR